MRQSLQSQQLRKFRLISRPFTFHNLPPHQHTARPPPNTKANSALSIALAILLLLLLTQPNQPSSQWVGSIDLSENEAADVSVVVPRDASWEDQEAAVIGKVADSLSGEKLDAVICVAGGWAGGNAKKGESLR